MKISLYTVRNVFIAVDVAVIIILVFFLIPNWVMRGDPVSRYFTSMRVEQMLNEKYDIHAEIEYIERDLKTGEYTVYFTTFLSKDYGEIFRVYYKKDILWRDTYG